jgi:MobA/VirD2-like, nuclease domain
VIGKISTPRGEHVGPLLYYLFGPGRREEHTDPHIVAGWRHPADLEPPLRPDGKRDFTKLVGLLLQPQAALGKRAYARPVWHCAMRAAPEDRMLSDDEWAGIAHEVMHRTGLSPYGQKDEAVRWVAVRHGDDHVHLVAMLARQDGGKPGLSWERYKVRAACLAAEQRYGLRSTAPADRTAARHPTRAENEKAARRGLDEAPRITLRRQVITAAASANSEDEFFARLDRAGALARKRFSVKNPGQVTGYSVALPGDTAKDGGPVWYGGAKLAADLSWPRLRQR